MKRFVVIVVSTLMFSMVLFPAARVTRSMQENLTAPEGHIYRSENPIPDQYLVMLRNDIEPGVVESTAYELASKYGGAVLSYPYQNIPNGFSVQMSEKEALALSLDSQVGFVEEIPQAGFESAPANFTQTRPDTEVEDAVSDAEAVQDWGLPPPESEVESTEGVATTTTKAVTTPLSKSSNPRYFKYGTRDIALFGISGSYNPNIERSRPRIVDYPNVVDPVVENCTYDVMPNTGGLRKYQLCVQKLKQAGLNHMRIWVSMNHSLGKLPKERGTGPNGANSYPNEQPFVWDATRRQWNLGQFNSVFFNRLFEVVNYCQTNDIIVGITLFDPWIEWERQEGPWHAANNTWGIGFTNKFFFMKGDNPAADPLTQDIDSPTTIQNPNWRLRNVQVALMQQTVNALSSLNNFYWELANETDLPGRVFGQPLIKWHKYMARKLWDMEKLKGRHHLIAANVTTNDVATQGVIDGLINFSDLPARPGLGIDVINSHYVRLRGQIGSIPELSRYSGIRLLTDYNVFENNGAPKTNNIKIWGYNEDRASGTENDYQFTADNGRVEAWEFFMNGGGLYDHLSYRWANPDDINNNVNQWKSPDTTRTYFKYLSKFMSTIPLVDMKRMTANQTQRWIITPPSYGPGKFWAAMSNSGPTSNGNTMFLFYIHRSTYKDLPDFDRYNAYEGGVKPGISFTVRNLSRGCSQANFKAEWFYPDGKKIEDDGGVTTSGVLLPVNHSTVPSFQMTATSQKELTSPRFRQDVVLKITRLTCQP